MYGEGKRGQRLVALFCLGCVLFSFPLLAIFNWPVLIGGIPALVLYVFVAWATVIGIAALIIEK